ncbi:MAG: TetR/AcrR family transcriptional regulator [Eubacteriales bacterium]|nr:TetR/AcrR family transcriptional regulator [Eubacteriales bacterium]
MGTKDDLLRVAKEEFLTKGYHDASLRQIAAKCGSTTGAIYGYFKDKDALFREIVEEDLQQLRTITNASTAKYMEIDNLREAFENFSNYSSFGKALIDEQMQFYKFFYEHKDVFTLLLFKAQGSSFENFLKDFIHEDAENTIRIYQKMKNMDEIDIYARRILELMVENSTMAAATIFKENDTFEDAKPYLEAMTIYYLGSFIAFIKFNKEEL